MQGTKFLHVLPQRTIEGYYGYLYQLIHITHNCLVCMDIARMWEMPLGISRIPMIMTAHAYPTCSVDQHTSESDASGTAGIDLEPKLWVDVVRDISNAAVHFFRYTHLSFRASRAPPTAAQRCLVSIPTTPWLALESRCRRSQANCVSGKISPANKTLLGGLHVIYHATVTPYRQPNWCPKGKVCKDTTGVCGPSQKIDQKITRHEPGRPLIGSISTVWTEEHIFHEQALCKATNRVYAVQ